MALGDPSSLNFKGSIPVSLIARSRAFSVRTISPSDNQPKFLSTPLSPLTTPPSVASNNFLEEIFLVSLTPPPENWGDSIISIEDSASSSSLVLPDIALAIAIVPATVPATASPINAALPPTGSEDKILDTP